MRQTADTSRCVASAGLKARERSRACVEPDQERATDHRPRARGDGYLTPTFPQVRCVHEVAAATHHCDLLFGATALLTPTQFARELVSAATCGALPSHR